MALEFYVSTNGSDNHGGSSEGSAKAGGTAAAVSSGNATVDLSADSPDLSGVSAGDTIRLNGRTDGIHGTDVFEITDVDDPNDEVDVTPTPSSSETGITWAIGGAWSTLQRAMDVVSAGDRVWAKADGDYVDDADADGVCAEIQRVGAAANPIVFEGYKSVPGDADGHPQEDDYRATINGTPNSLDSAIAVDGGISGTAPLYYVFKNLLLKNCSSQGANLGNHSNVTLKNCRFTANLIGAYANQPCHFEACSFDNNSVHGCFAQGTLIHCRFFNNTQNGISAAGPCNLLLSKVYGNDGDGFNGTVSEGPYILLNNTFDGDGKPSGKAGLSLDGTTASVVANNIIHDFDVGIKAASNQGDRLIVRNNLFANNNTNRQDFPEGLGDQSASDPEFMDEGSGDYRLKFGSPARGAGTPAHIDIGAGQRREVGTHGPTNVGVQI